MTTEALETAIGIAGGQTALGRLIGKDQKSIWAWLNTTKQVPAEFAIPIEKAVEGKVTRHELRPDIYPIDDPAPAGHPKHKETHQAAPTA